MKPGNATVDSMAKAILDFETSKRADKNRSFQHAQEQESPFPFPSNVRIAHRELRRMARRLAKLALKEKEKLESLMVDRDLYLTRIHHLEAEIDRLDPDGTR